MNWSVTYRDKNGKQSRIVLEADSRESLFSILEERGISAIRIGTAQECRKPHRKALLPVGVCLIFLVAVLIGIWLAKKPNADSPEQRPIKKPSRISVATPSPATRVLPKEKVASKDKSDKPVGPQKVGEERDGYVLLPNGKMHRRRGVKTVEPGGVDRSHPAAIFDHSTDNEFAVILTLQPGESLIGGPLRHGKDYEASFRESLKTPIIVSEDDSDEVKALKRAVIEARLQMKEALDRGEDIKKIIADSYEEAQKLAIYKDTLREQVNAASNEENMTDEELDDLITAANQMLEAKGIAPMKFGALTRARIRNLKK